MTTNVVDMINSIVWSLTMSTKMGGVTGGVNRGEPERVLRRAVARAGCVSSVMDQLSECGFQKTRGRRSAHIAPTSANVRGSSTRRTGPKQTTPSPGTSNGIEQLGRSQLLPRVPPADCGRISMVRPYARAPRNFKTKAIRLAPNANGKSTTQDAAFITYGQSFQPSKPHLAAIGEAGFGLV